MSEISEIFQNVYSAKLHSKHPLSAPLRPSSLWLNLTSLKAGKQISIVDVINAKFTLFVAGLRFGDYVMPWQNEDFSTVFKICRNFWGNYLFKLMYVYTL